MMTTKERLARFIEDTYYTALIFIRDVLEHWHVLHAPTEAELQRNTEKMFANVAF